MKRLLGLGAIVALVAAACGGETRSAADDWPTKDTVSGAQIDLATVAGEDAMLWFWSPDCQHCSRAAPSIAEAQRTYGDDVRFLGVVGADAPTDLQDFVDEHGLDGFEHVVDPCYELWDAFGVAAVPTYVMLGADGTTSYRMGALTSDALDADLQQLVSC